VTSGFSIDEVRVKGGNMPDAIARFGRGLSLLTGPSDTGKSFIADATNHVFGASGSLRDVPERGNYDRILVQICVYETGTVYTLERAWAGGAVLLYPLAASDVEEFSPSKILKDTHDGTDDSVSGLLLGFSGLQGKQLRKNASGAKDSLSFRNLLNYVLVQEERIITKNSPLLSGQVMDVTKEESIFRCLLTGVDDSAVNTLPDAKVRRGLDAGRKEVLETLIAQAKERIAATGSQDDLIKEIAVVEEALSNQTAFVENISAELDQQQTLLKELWATRQKKLARQEQISVLNERFNLLKEHYDADIARLQSTQESGRLLVQLAEGPCPLCGADPANHRHEGLLKSDDVEQLTGACRAEQRKVERLKQELVKTLERLSQESLEIGVAAAADDARIAELRSTIATDLEPKVRLTKEGFAGLLERKKAAERALTAYDELRRLESTRAEFDTKTKLEASKQIYESTPVRVTDELATIIQDLLKEWNYPSLDRVVFDAQTRDIVINGKPRSSHGKGYRALTYAAFVVGVMLFCRRKQLPHPGFIVLDSPLVTYRKPDTAAEDLISEGMVTPFYSYLASLAEDCQVVIIENDEPSPEIALASTYTHFTKNVGLGRFGFLLPPAGPGP
jgi:hypothetical protein